MKFIAEFKKQQQEEKKKNVAKGLTYLGGSAIVGQQTIRSGIPRLLGVRLESHSTNKKNAKEILKNDGILDPNKSGTGAIRALDALEGEINTTDTAKAKGKVYVTGVHKDAKPRVMKNPYGKDKIIDPNKGNIIDRLIARKNSRGVYRGQSTIDWDDVNQDQNKIKLLQEEVKDLEKKVKEKYNVNENKKYSKKFKPLSISSEEKLLDKKISEIKNLREKTKIRLVKARIKAFGKGLLPQTGRSLYIGGGDDYFNKNFKPDFDDVGAMYSENKIKVSGNRFSATMEALKREGGGNRLKGVVKLVKANPSRSLAGAGILAIGSAVTAKLGQAAYKNLVFSDGRVKGHTRKSKSGKWSTVKSFVRDKLKK